MSIETVATFLGWCTVINSIVLLISTVALMSCRKWISKIHAGMFEIDESTLNLCYFRYLANFKILTIVFNLAPYLALKIMAG